MVAPARATSSIARMVSDGPRPHSVTSLSTPAAGSGPRPTVLMRRLYGRDHLAQVLASFRVSLVTNDAVKMIWGPAPTLAATPAALSGPMQLLADLPDPSYRLLILASGALIALGLHGLVSHTRLGMLVRAGASDRGMAELMGVRVDHVFTGVFALGAALAAVAGALVGPIAAVQIGVGESILIPAPVVVVIGGIGSVRGALVAALLVGLVDTIGRAFVPPLLLATMSPRVAADLGPAISEIAMSALMAVVLSVKPTGPRAGTWAAADEARVGAGRSGLAGRVRRCDPGPLAPAATGGGCRAESASGPTSR